MAHSQCLFIIIIIYYYYYYCDLLLLIVGICHRGTILDYFGLHVAVA